jgi:hypothetical protein
VNVFSSDEMLAAYAATFFPGTHSEIGVYSVEGWDFRLVRIGNRRPEVTGPFMDFWEPIERTQTLLDSGGSRIRYLPRVSVESVAVEEGVPNLKGMSPAPFVRWSDLGDWSGFEELVTTRNRSLPADSRRQLRRLEREVGSIQFVSEEQGDEAFDACALWKSARHRHVAANFRDARHREFLQRLRDDGVSRVSSVRAGSRLLAAHIGLLYEDRFYYWIPAYDPEYHKYSPGRLLLEHLLEASCARGDVEFDLLVGNEAYKWNYATGARLVGPIGRAPRLATATSAAVAA